MTKTKILYLDHAPYEGGAEVSLRELVVNLDSYLYQPVMVVTHQFLDKIKGRNIDSKEFKYNWLKYRYIFPLLVDVAKLVRIINYFKPQVIHTNTRVTNIIGGLLYYARQMKLLKNVQIINHVRDMDPLTGWKFKLIGKCDLIIANSQQVKDFLVKNGINADRVQVIYNGIDPERFNPTQVPNVPNSDPVITFIGQIYPRKGVDVLIKSFKKITDAHIKSRLWIVGKDPSETEENLDNYQALAQNLGINSKIEWLGYQSDPVEILAQTDVFALPSREEPFGRVLIEAMAMKLPVVASDVGGIPEIVVNGVTGYLVKPEDENDLAEKTIELLKDSEKRIRFGEKGRQLVETYFSLDKHVKSIEEVYKNLIYT